MRGMEQFFKDEDNAGNNVMLVTLGCWVLSVLIGLGLLGVAVWAIIRIVQHFCN